MASADEVNSTLKNLVSNVGLLVNGTALINAVNAISSTLATSLATVHGFGGSAVMPAAVASVVIGNAQLASTGVISFSPGNTGAATTVFTAGVYVGPITAGSFSLVVNTGSSVSSGLFYYVGYNP
jgi:hypothetical protein